MKALMIKKQVTGPTMLPKKSLGSMLGMDPGDPDQDQEAPPDMDTPEVSEMEGEGTIDPMVAGYKDQADTCGTCTHYRGGKCELISGPVTDSGWCKLYEEGLGEMDSGLDKLASSGGDLGGMEGATDLGLAG